MYMSNRVKECVCKRSQWNLHLRSLAAWVVLGASFLVGPTANAQNTGKWEAINSSGSAVASGPTLDVSQFVAVGSVDIGTATADCIS
jgi:hypothetical protein